MKFYILTSGNIETLRKHAESIPLSEQVVIINTLDDDYSRSASNYCIQNNIEYYVTESDGTAGTGKNSVMKKFLESDNEYMVQVDGDDQITKMGYLYYSMLPYDENPPDLLVLYNQYQQVVTHWRPLPDGTVEPEKTRLMTGWKRPYGEWMDRLEPNRFYKWLKETPMTGPHPRPREFEFGDRSDEELMRWCVHREEWEKFIWKHAVGNDTHRDVFSRMVFYSRKAAELVDFTNQLKVGEDTIAYLEMRLHHLKGDINIGRHDERNGMTYLYIHDNVGVSKTEQESSDPLSTRSQSYEWVVTLWNWVNQHDLETRYKSVEELQFEDYD